MTQAELSSDDHALLLKYRAKVDDNGGSITHDLNDPEQLAFVKLMHNLCGNTEEDFPGLHAMLAAPQPQAAMLESAAVGDGDGWQTAVEVADIGAVAIGGPAAANGYATVVGGFQACNLSLLIMSPDGSRILAHGANAGQAPLATLPVSTDDASAQPFAPGSTAMMTYFYQQGSASPVSGTVHRVAPAAVQGPTVIEPARENGNTNPFNTNAINIGLGRQPALDRTYLARCDYVFNEPDQNNPIGRVPLVGNVTFNAAIQPLQSGTIVIDIFFVRDLGGKSSPLVATDMNNVLANFNIAPDNPNQLNWNLPMEPNRSPPQPAQAYNPVVFSSIPWETEKLAYLTVSITVMVDNGTGGSSPVAVTIQSRDAPGEDQIAGMTSIMPLEFIWHCLGEDTVVTMADGSTRTIPQIKALDEVLCGPRGTCPGWRRKRRKGTVSVTHNGLHFQKVYVLETECGKTLVASAEHVIFTPAGGVAARKLRPGMELLTAEGRTALKSVREEDGGGRNLWNLSLGQAPQIHEVKPDVGQFYANGILVGDARATRAMRYAQINDIDWVKAHVPESFHTDVESTFRRRTRVTTR
jgi:hypothetical protein